MANLIDKLNILRNLDPYSKWNLLEKYVNKLNPLASLGEYGKTWKVDERFNKDCEVIDPYRKNKERLYMLQQYTKISNSIDGDIVECGTFKGHSAYIIGSVAQTNKFIHLFDSWEGLSSPGIFDGSYWKRGALNSTENEARNLLNNHPNYTFHRGWIPSSFQNVEIQQISLLHLDLDLYEPTLQSLQYFWSKVMPGGIVISDDYGFITCPGVKKAFDDFFSEKNDIFHLTTGQAVVIKSV